MTLFQSSKCYRSTTQTLKNPLLARHTINPSRTHPSFILPAFYSIPPYDSVLRGWNPIRTMAPSNMQPNTASTLKRSRLELSEHRNQDRCDSFDRDEKRRTKYAKIEHGMDSWRSRQASKAPLASRTSNNLNRYTGSTANDFNPAIKLDK